MEREPHTFDPSAAPMSLDDYIAYWNGSAAVRSFMEARMVARDEVWIVLEHVPDMAMLWLMMNQDRVEDLLGQLFAAVAELHARGVVHFDAHLGNVVTDGTRFVLTDFGLAMANDFELDARERSFLTRHRHYDYGVALGNLGQMLCVAVSEPATGRAVARAIDSLESLPVAYRPELIAALRRYRGPIVYMTDLFDRIRRPSKRARYDDAALRELLVAAGVPTST